VSYSREYLRESAEIYWASTSFGRLKMRNSFWILLRPTSRNGALRTVAIETLIGEFD
jgi:hypothetical protein